MNEYIYVAHRNKDGRLLALHRVTEIHEDSKSVDKSMFFVLENGETFEVAFFRKEAVN